MLIDVHQNYKK